MYPPRRSILRKNRNHPVLGFSYRALRSNLIQVC